MPTTIKVLARNNETKTTKQKQRTKLKYAYSVYKTPNNARYKTWDYLVCQRTKVNSHSIKRKIKIK